VGSVRRPIAKRLLDLVVAGLLLVLLLPPLVVVLIAFALDVLLVPADRGALFYRETRISRGRAFHLLKFRTLRRPALERAGGHARPHEAEATNLTWVGRRILKPWYLDEVPQLLNVLRGEISLVGPRPWPPEMVRRQLAEGLSYRNEIAAGLTGPAQVTKGQGRSFAELDLDYVARSRTLSTPELVLQDLRILLQTVGVVLRRQGLSY
jgi:lipopolysaccharide/colanic/teichoic acid biosynthesis glycosyltransferase